MKGKKMLVVWDNIWIHRSKKVTRFLEKYRSAFITRRFPPYAPELNPDEPVWNLPNTMTWRTGAPAAKEKCAA